MYFYIWFFVISIHVDTMTLHIIFYKHLIIYCEQTFIEIKIDFWKALLCFNLSFLVQKKVCK